MPTAIVSRFFKNKHDEAPDALASLGRWASAALSISPHVFVAIDPTRDFGARALLQTTFPGVGIVEVSPWGRSVAPLNELIRAAVGCGAKRMLVASLEFPPDAASAAALGNAMDEETLVAGARLEGHDFSPGMHQAADAYQVPWNTYALWSLPLLARTGFPLASESLYDLEHSGMEDRAAMAVLQRLWPALEAKLVSISGFPDAWDMTGWSSGRRAEHEEKMETKGSRSDAQLAALGLSSPRVLHIKH